MTASNGSAVLDDLPPADASPTPAKATARKATKATKATKAPGDAAPKRGAGRPPRNNLERRLDEAITGIGVGVCIFNAEDGQTVIKGATPLAQALDRLAAENPKVQASLERFLTAGAWSGVVMAVTPILVGIAANHGVVPPIMAELLTADDGDE